MTDRVLSMLYQYLLSNQTLELDRSFQIYCKILSIEHSKYKETQIPRKKFKKFRKVHLGQSSRKYSYKWAIDVPQEENFIQKCLLTCTILAFAQINFFESKRKDKKFLYLSGIKSSIESKRKYAFKILNNELEKLFSVTNLKRTGPYNLTSTIILLSKTYKCQFFVFESFNHSTKLFYTYPKSYNDSLKPIYLFRPEFDSDHVMFIKNINSFFRANSYICFGCFKPFKRLKDSRSPHLCSKKESCFACRCFFQNGKTYINQALDKQFCDRFVTSENSFLCSTCNCQVFSEKCYRNHKRICKGKGYFGYKCLKCNKFSYCQNNTSEEVKNNHQCFKSSFCKLCFNLKEDNHLCPIRKEKPQKYLTRLAFFEVIFDINNVPIAFIFYREEIERGFFTPHAFFQKTFFQKNQEVQNELFKTLYLEPEWKIDRTFKQKPENETSAFFQQIKRIRESTSDDIETAALQYILQKNFTHTTYICEDSSSKNLVIL